MRRKFLSIVSYSLFAIILLSGISYGVKETIISENMKDIFGGSFSLAGSGNIWTRNPIHNYVESCSEKGDFTFITKQINIGDAFADVIYVAMETSFSPGSNNSSLGIYLHNGPVQTNNFKDFFFQNFSLIYTIENNTASTRNGSKWNHIFKFYKNGLNNITPAVRGIGVCARVYSIKVYYYYCGEKYFNGVKFPKTKSPSEGRKKVEANCSVNSSPSNQGRILSGFCRYNGTWDYSMDIGCFCEQGYEQNSLMKCSPCRSNHFKPTSSNTTCKSCPKGSTNTSNGTSCKCMKGYYHSTLNANPTTAPCFGPIKEKLKISVKKRDKTFNVTWTAVKVEDELKHSLRYDVECFLCEGQKCNMTCQNVKYKPRQNNLTETFVEISNLHPGHRYKFIVYPKTVINKFIGKENWNYTEQEADTYSVPTTASTKPPITNSSKTKSKTTYFDYVVVSGIASGVLFMIMVVLLIIVVKSKTARINRRHLLTGNEHQVELPDIGQKLYVDPSIYDNPEEALNEFTSELDPSVLEVEKLIGGGEFGNVYKGTMKCNEGKSMAVAVKTLKTDHTVKNENDFLLEASIMGQFNDLNVIHLEGVITKSFPRMIVTEYMSNGSLDRFLRLNDEGLTYLQLISMARGVASGMVYLCAKNFIHRDLAARNILVNDDLLCKIADFGLSRFVETEGSDGEHSISGGKIPVRWTAPEVIKYRKYSFSSDVWSYGILLWEIMSFGEKPYWEWENHEVIKKVEEGFRLPAYKDCPRAVHNLMLSCWKANRGERPKFEHIRQVLNGWITSPKTIVQDSKDSGIGDWLHSIKMGEYRSTFINADYESPYQLMGIGDKDLLKIGVRLIGHRKTILKAIKAFDDTKDEVRVVGRLSTGVQTQSTLSHKKMAHGYVYILLATVLYSTYQLATGEIGHLLPNDNSLSKSFIPRAGKWRYLTKEGLYYVCHSKAWLQSTDELDTAGIRELTVTVVYKNYEKSSGNTLNKTAFYLGVLTTSDHIDKFQADGILNKNNSQVTSTKFVSVNYPIGKLRILIRSRDEEDCMVVYQVQITYRFCTKKTFFEVAKFPKTFAPRNGSVPLKVEGSCSYGSKIPVAYCDSNGEWSYNETLPCSCAPGEVMSSVGCVELSCIIQDVKAVRLSNTRAIIFWKQKTKPKIQYDVICKKCKDHKCDQNCPETVRLEKNKTNISGKNSSDITGLERGHDYLFIVVGKIHVEAVNENYWNETSRKVQLRALPEKVKNLTFTSVDHDRIALTWLPPSNIDSTSIIYEIGCRVHCSLDKKCTTDRCKKLKFIPSRQNLLHTNVTIAGLRNDGLLCIYVFEVRAKHRFYNNSEEPLGIEWNFVAINYTDFKEVIPTVSKSFNVVGVVIGVSVLFLAVLFAIAGTRCYNRWKRRKVELPHIGQKLYVDPTIYDSPEDALNEFTSELDPSALEVEKIIGGGQFGDVYKGIIKCNEGKSMAVAVKTLKTDHTAKNENDFLLEASIMGQFNDLNVIHLEGVITKSFPRMIVTEYMSNGSLDRFLRLNDENLTHLQLIGMARGVASGMAYLSAMNFIHRDLAARNILVNDDLLCKIADFGLSRFLETEGSDGEYSISGGKIPVRWTAPEVIKYRKYSSASDVWSYGILLWEIMSFGERPYWEWENHEVIKEVEEGFRLPAPKDCPRAVHNLMLSCWKANRSERPKFEHIRQVLNGWITSPKTLVEDSKDSGIGDWLHSIKMGEYRSIFLNADYETQYQLMGIKDKDLLKIGVRLIGHRKTILNAIKAFDDTKDADEINMSLTRTESNLLQPSQSDI